MKISLIQQPFSLNSNFSFFFFAQREFFFHIKILCRVFNVFCRYFVIQKCLLHVTSDSRPECDRDTHKYSRVNSCYYYFALFYANLCDISFAFCCCLLIERHSATHSKPSQPTHTTPLQILFQFSPIFLSFIHVKIFYGIVFNFFHYQICVSVHT